VQYAFNQRQRILILEFMKRIGKNTKRIVVFAVIIVASFATNAIHSILNPSVARDYDIAYIGRHCAGITQDQAQCISEHIRYDAMFGGAWYIFEQKMDTASAGDFEAAWRPAIEEVLCFPFLGCAIPPSLRGDCLAN